MIRSILESIVFRVVLAFDVLRKQMGIDYKKIWYVFLKMYYVTVIPILIFQC